MDNRKPNRIKPRSLARECAFKAVFAWRISGVDCQTELQNALNQYADSAVDKPFAHLLVTKFVDHHKEVVSTVQTYFKQQSTASLTDVEQTVVELAATEILYGVDTPVKVVINEGVELCKIYGTQDGFRFTNAVLDALARDLGGLPKDA